MGDGTIVQKTAPALIPTLSGVNSINAGFDYASVLKSDGTIWSWGRNLNGQLGDGTNVDQLSPIQQVQGNFSNVNKIFAEYNHTFAIKNDGTLWAWGQNTNNALGDGSSSGVHRYVPIQSIVLSEAVSFAAGAHHTLALKNDGTVWSWGNNSSGQL